MVKWNRIGRCILRLFTDKCTIYNHYEENGIDKWKRTVLDNVQWTHNKVRTTISGGIINETRVESITIDFSRERDYHEPVEWNGSGWTLDNKGQDIILLGIGEDINETYTIKNLRADHSYVGTIIEVSDNRNRDYLKTIKVVAK